MARSNPDLEGVKRNMEQILSNQKSGFEQIRKGGANGVADATPNETSAPPAVARQLADACHTTASDIQKAGEDIVQIASGIAAETAALAELLRRHGAEISDRIEQFTVMTNRISNVVRDVRADLSPSKSSPPPLTPGE
jgi:hypothetical protein